MGRETHGLDWACLRPSYLANDGGVYRLLIRYLEDLQRYPEAPEVTRVKLPVFFAGGAVPRGGCVGGPGDPDCYLDVLLTTPAARTLESSVPGVERTSENAGPGPGAWDSGVVALEKLWDAGTWKVAYRVRARVPGIQPLEIAAVSLRRALLERRSRVTNDVFAGEDGIDRRWRCQTCLGMEADVPLLPAVFAQRTPYDVFPGPAGAADGAACRGSAGCRWCAEIRGYRVHLADSVRELVCPCCGGRRALTREECRKLLPYLRFRERR